MSDYILSYTKGKPVVFLKKGDHCDIIHIDEPKKEEKKGGNDKDDSCIDCLRGGCNKCTDDCADSKIRCCKNCKRSCTK